MTVDGLAPAGDWSLVVPSLDDPDVDRVQELVDQARSRGALDLRSRQPLPGSTPVTAAEHTVPVPVALADAEATRDLGRRIAGALRPGDLLVLSGPLGAGKTTFTQGLGEALGVRGRVTSPTFVLARVHRGPLPLVHVDAYRLRDAALDLDDLDLDAALEDAVTVVEWGEGVVEGLAEDRLVVRLDRATGDELGDGRTASTRATGRRWAVVTEP